MEKYSDKVRYLPNVSDLYASATEEWTTLGLVKPSRAEAEKRDEYLKVCDAMYAGNPSTPLQCVLVVSAVLGALQLISDHDTCLSEDDQCAIRKVAKEYLLRRERAKSKEPDHNLLHIQNAIYLDETKDAGPKIELGQVIRYRNRQGRIRECIIVDSGTSKLTGEYSMTIQADANEAEMFTMTDMEDEILSLRVSPELKPCL